MVYRRSFPMCLQVQRQTRKKSFSWFFVTRRKRRCTYCNWYQERKLSKNGDISETEQEHRDHKKPRFDAWDRNMEHFGQTLVQQMIKCGKTCMRSTGALKTFLVTPALLINESRNRAKLIRLADLLQTISIQMFAVHISLLLQGK